LRRRLARGAWEVGVEAVGLEGIKADDPEPFKGSGGAVERSTSSVVRDVHQRDHDPVFGAGLVHGAVKVAVLVLEGVGKVVLEPL
jgi:hypothetical protein